MDQAHGPARLTSEVDRAALQRRALSVLAFGQVVGSAAMGASVTVGAFVIEDLLGRGTAWAGVASASVTGGAALFARRLSSLMIRHGRRPGLQLGYTIAAVGGITALIGVETEVLAVFIAGLLLFGAGQAANLLARYAATDLADPEARGSAMAFVVFFSTFGAVFGPVMIDPAERAGSAWFGLHRYSGPWLLAAVLFVGAALNAAIRLRPDPLVVAGGRLRDGPIGHRPSMRASIAVVLSHPSARLGLAAMVVSQFTMVAVMAMTPVHMKLHGHESLSQYVVSLHIAGMYAFAPWIGKFCDRRGRVPTIAIGTVLLAVASSMAALSGDAHLMLFPSLWLLGVGWNFGLIGGSSLLSESVPAGERVGVQGTADLLMSLFGGSAGFASGFIRRAWGFHLLAVGATVAAGLLMVVVASRVWRAGGRLLGGVVGDGHAR